MVDEWLRRILDNPSGYSMIIARVENLESFREDYGFVACDDVLRAIGTLIERTAGELDPESSFVGHLSATEILLIISEAQRERALAAAYERVVTAVDDVNAALQAADEWITEHVPEDDLEQWDALAHAMVVAEDPELPSRTDWRALGLDDAEAAARWLQHARSD